MSFTPYQKKSPGDVLKLQDWLTIQRRIKEELRTHRHHGQDQEGGTEADAIGPRIGQGAFRPGAVTTAKLAAGAVGAVAMQDGAMLGEHFDRDDRLPERYLRFTDTGGHDHDGVNSRALPAGVIGTVQIEDDSLTEDKLHILPESIELTPSEETYAHGRAFTPGNALRAARELLDHVGMKARPLLYPAGYDAIRNGQLVIQGFELHKSLDDSDGEFAGQYIYLEFTVPLVPLVARSEAQILDDKLLAAVVPDLGPADQSGYLRVVRGNGSTSRPFLPLTNGVPFNYKTAE